MCSRGATRVPPHIVLRAMERHSCSRIGGTVRRCYSITRSHRASRAHSPPRGCRAPTSTRLSPTGCALAARPVPATGTAEGGYSSRSSAYESEAEYNTDVKQEQDDAPSPVRWRVAASSHRTSVQTPTQRTGVPISEQAAVTGPARRIEALRCLAAARRTNHRGCWNCYNKPTRILYG